MISAFSLHSSFLSVQTAVGCPWHFSSFSLYQASAFDEEHVIPNLIQKLMYMPFSAMWWKYSYLLAFAYQEGKDIIVCLESL